MSQLVKNMMVYSDSYQYGQLSYSELWDSFMLVLQELKNYEINNYHRIQSHNECQLICQQLQKELDLKKIEIIEKLSELENLQKKLNRSKRLSWKERLTGKIK